MNNSLTIAVDFDGTIVEHKYPEIGEAIPFALHTLKALQKKGHRLILWSYRTGRELDDAVEYCRRQGVEFYAVNRSYPEEKFSEIVGRKILADIYIDDCNLGGLPSWPEIYKMIHPEDSPKKEKKKWW